MKRTIAVPALAALLALAGCSSLFNVQRTPFTTYSPQLAAPPAPSAPPVDWQLMVETPLASDTLDTARMLVSPTPGVLEVFPAARWRDPNGRRIWTDAIAALCADRLRPGGWVVEHPVDWSTQEQQQFIAAIGNGGSADMNFEAKGDIGAGLRIRADQAVLDATPHGLLADRTAIAALLLDQIGDGAP